MSRKGKLAEQFKLANCIVEVDTGLLTKALTHPSYSQENEAVENNQRLEFLGDAVLNMVVAEYLYKNFPERPEGDLTRIRAKVVCEKALVKVANTLKVGEYLYLGRGEELSGGRKRNSILADTVEAVVGAVYLDQGLEYARDFILRYLAQDIHEVAEGNFYDYKSQLQELVQSRGKDNVTYAILEESGPAHDKTFIAGVFYRHKLLAQGVGKSKKEAEQKAAEKVLQMKVFEG
ncbi:MULTISPECIES: ribonuclease III [Syntrophothermus]|uniref:Ribonuclease 3 n=1 Tax=Syntrophothermus lipocalidus (strain DSM 12680 / TGB-C1) TaxID=643648 RepID=D7CMX5_SYNLT|nr:MULTISPECIES: ribonuclease III [Syntrophothermus]ADI02060.1 ribonuclease III [Syntrophothermus lipocalidus DSM 12680]NSW82482.1 ribonuclease III [Syntrophothermus sp.]